MQTSRPTWRCTRRLDPLETLVPLSASTGIPVGALVRFVLARWASAGSESCCLPARRSSRGCRRPSPKPSRPIPPRRAWLPTKWFGRWSPGCVTARHVMPPEQVTLGLGGPACSDHPSQQPVAVEQLVLEDEADMCHEGHEEGDVTSDVNGDGVIGDHDGPQPCERHDEQEEIEPALGPVGQGAFSWRTAPRPTAATRPGGATTAAARSGWRMLRPRITWAVSSRSPDASPSPPRPRPWPGYPPRPRPRPRPPPSLLEEVPDRELSGEGGGGQPMQRSADESVTRRVRARPSGNGRSVDDGILPHASPPGPRPPRRPCLPTMASGCTRASPPCHVIDEPGYFSSSYLNRREFVQKQ